MTDPPCFLQRDQKNAADHGKPAHCKAVVGKGLEGGIFCNVMKQLHTGKTYQAGNHGGTCKDQPVADFKRGVRKQIVQLCNARSEDPGDGLKE